MTRAMQGPCEEIEQTCLFRWAALESGAHPELALLHAIPNGGKRSKSEAARMKAAGVKPGVPDMFLPVAREGCHGLYIELKRRDGGRVSTEQTAWMDALARQGYKTALCHGWDAAREEIQRYSGREMGMRLSKIGKVVKEARQCILCNTRERTGQEANLIQQWIGAGEAMYPVDENVRLTEQGAAALMEMEGKDAEAVAWRSVGDGSELAEALKGIPARIDGAALAWKVCLKVEIQSGTARVTELEDGSMAYVWEALLEPCKRKGKLLRMTRVDGKQGVYAVYAEDDLAGVVSGISQEEREEMLRTLREIC